MWVFISVIVIAIVVCAIVIVDVWLQWKRHKESEIEQGWFGHTNKYDAYTKCVKVLNSCETPKQKMNANNMVKAFTNLYNDRELNEMLRNEYSFIRYK